MFTAIEEIPHNVCGIIGNRYVITAPVDEPIEKDFMKYHLHDEYPKGEKEQPLFALIGRNTKPYGPIHMSIKVLEKVKDRSVHFPEIVKCGKIEKLYFGSEGEQEVEHDPEQGCRPYLIVKYDATPISVLPFLSPQRSVPPILALMIGLGCVRALAALNRAGFVHRFVTPFNFAITNPPTKKNILEKMIITDFSAVLPWPCKPRVFVPFIGTYRYSSVRAHWGREQGPSDDIISVIYMVAEMLHGKLPWRSLSDNQDRICYFKTYFYKTDAFKKLPRQLRQIYREMLSKTGSAAVDFKSIIELFKRALDKLDHNNKFQIPEWVLCDQQTKSDKDC